MFVLSDDQNQKNKMLSWNVQVCMLSIPFFKNKNQFRDLSITQCLGVCALFTSGGDSPWQPGATCVRNKLFD